MQKCKNAFTAIFSGGWKMQKNAKNVFAYFSLPWSSPIYRIYLIHIVFNCLCESGRHNKGDKGDVCVHLTAPPRSPRVNGVRYYPGLRNGLLGCRPCWRGSLLPAFASSPRPERHNLTLKTNTTLSTTMSHAKVFLLLSFLYKA